MIAYGIANHTPDDIVMYLNSIHDIPFKDIGILPLKLKLDANKVKKLPEYVLIQTVPDMFRNIKIINEYLKGHKLFIFGSPYDLFQYNVQPLDYEVGTPIQLEGIVLKDTIDIDFNLPSIVLEKSDDSFLEVVMTKVNETRSFLRPFMTFVYTTPNATHQKPIKILTCLYIIHSKVVNAKTDKKFESIQQYVVNNLGLSKPKLEKWTNIVKNNEIHRYMAAFTSYYKSMDAKRAVNVDDLCRAHEISAYEFRYILSVVSTLDKLDVDYQAIYKTL